MKLHDQKKSSPTTSQGYWEQNIEGFSGFYDTGSEEKLSGPPLIRGLYRAFVFPIEKRFMRVRYDMVRTFIDLEVRSGTRVADIGCGSGVFSIAMAQKGADVLALDFAQSALRLTERNIPEGLRPQVVIRHHDIALAAIPNVDLALAIGVLPYLEDAGAFLENIAPRCNVLMFNFLNFRNPINRVRNVFRIIDPRGYFYHDKLEIERALRKCGFARCEFKRLATGYMTYAHRL
jgi:cyclopropane fatty-acyl-phospholipid synthase-like methyltransferase